MKLNREDIRRAIDMQEHSYLLLKWMAKAVEEGFIGLKTAHGYSSLPEAAKAWILRHYLNIPSEARVAQEDLSDFCAFFSTYLENSFDLVPDAGYQLYSPDAHCYCPMCSWLVSAPNLKTKKLTPADKRQALSIKADTIRDVAAEHRVTMTDKDIDAMMNDPRLREAVSLVAYGKDLVRRVKGIATGPAILALWRGFAWTETGSPKKKFRLKAEIILSAEKQLSDAILAYAGTN